ncbi:MAG: helix-turn-helix transcriptional regulator [Neisseriaceae bacterium]|nr:helix-turn-helix transcriptional regulator [Neisseriaceae bacterium]
MKTTPFDTMICPTARALACIGDNWSLLILRDAFQGCRRFDDFQRSSGIPSNTLTRRLKQLVEKGLLVKVPYQQRPLRHEYVPTDMGQELFPILALLFAWGNRYLTPEGEAVRQTSPEGALLTPIVVDQGTQQPITLATVRLQAGPAANADVLARVAQVAALWSSHTDIKEIQ